jgi:POT family proton-dependent oligopeptide transporter
MSRRPFLTAPLPSDRMPHGIPYIVGNEAAERFSFYGMKAILVVYMTRYLCDWSGQLDVMPDAQAKSVMHAFVAGAYFFSLPGAILSDWLWGKYRTILWLSLVYCLGHFALAAVPGYAGLYLGLALIALGAGGIKPCVSANVGDQFGDQNRHLMEKVFGWFYLSINVGAFLSTLLTPWLLESEWMRSHFGEGMVQEVTIGIPAVFGFRAALPLKTYEVAFGVPGVLMGLATLIFWLGRNKFIHVPPGGNEFLREMTSQKTIGVLLRLIPLYLFIAVFWSLYDQTGSAWVLQAEDMDRHMRWIAFSWRFPWVTLEYQEVLPAAVQAINPLLILIYVPLFSYVVYPAAGQIVRVTPLRKIATGLFLIAAAFALSGWLQTRIDAGGHPSAYWQLVAYGILTAAEVLVSVTALEFSYTQAPKRMKSLVMALYLLSVSLGNLFTSAVNLVAGGTLTGARYYWFFTGLMLVASLAFIPYAMSYRYRTEIQE